MGIKLCDSSGPSNISRDSIDAVVGSSITNLRYMEGEDLTQSDPSLVTTDLPPVDPSTPAEPYLAPRQVFTTFLLTGGSDSLVMCFRVGTDALCLSLTLSTSYGSVLVFFCGTIVNPCVLLRSSSTVTYLFCPPSVALGNAQQEWLDLRIHSSTRRWRLPGLQCLSKSEPWTHSDLTHTLLNHTQFTLFSLAFCYGLSKHGIEQTSWQRRWMFLQICDTCGGSFWTTITFLLISYLYKFTNIFFHHLLVNMFSYVWIK